MDPQASRLQHPTWSPTVLSIQQPKTSKTSPKGNCFTCLWGPDKAKTPAPQNPRNPNAVEADKPEALRLHYCRGFKNYEHPGPMFLVQLCYHIPQVYPKMILMIIYASPCTRWTLQVHMFILYTANNLRTHKSYMQV